MKTVIKDPFMDGLIARGLEQGIEQGIDRGKVIEAADMLLHYMQARWDVPEGIRKRVTSCTDRAQLEAWFDSAIHANTVGEIFKD